MRFVQNETCTLRGETVIGIANSGSDEDEDAIPSCMYPRNLIALVAGT